MSEDIVKLQLYCSDGENDDKVIVTAISKYILGMEGGGNRVELVRDDCHLSIFIRQTTFEHLTLMEMFFEFEKLGYRLVSGSTWFDNAGETEFFRFDGGKLYTFDSEDDFLAWDAVNVEIADETEEKLLKAFKDEPWYMLIKFNCAQRIDGKNLGKIKQQAKNVFEERHISSSKTAFKEGVMYILYVGYFYDVYDMVISNYCVGDIFAVINKMQGTNFSMIIHHEEFPADCHSFIDNNKLKTRFINDGKYTKSIVPISTDDILDTNDGSNSEPNYCQASNNLKLERTSASGVGTHEECMKNILAASREHGFRLSSKLKTSLIVLPLIVIEEGVAKSNVYNVKSIAVGRIFARINKWGNYQFESDDYSIFDAVENKLYTLQKDFTWLVH